jgi:hypothetical protein
MFNQPVPLMPQLHPGYGNSTEIDHYLRRGWRRIQTDARFPAALTELLARGFVVNHSDPDYLTSALLPFQEDWALLWRTWGSASW